MGVRAEVLCGLLHGSVEYLYAHMRIPLVMKLRERIAVGEQGDNLRNSYSCVFNGELPGCATGYCLQVFHTVIDIAKSAGSVNIRNEQTA